MIEIILTEIQRQEMIDIDLTNDVRYSALINGKFRITHKTDGYRRKHLTVEEWIKLAESEARKNLTQ